MSEVIKVTVLPYPELSDEAKVVAREWYRETGLDYPWYEFVYADFEAICELMGVSLVHASIRLLGGGTRTEPKIHFCGFWSQGDGACFEAYYRYRKAARQAIRRYAPLDHELHRIVDALTDIQRRNFYQLKAATSHRGRYYHEYSMHVDVGRRDAEMTADAEEAVTEGLRDLARWLFRQLERDYEGLTSDEAVENAIEGYRFTADGRFYH